jgi:hypothetical protein
MVLTDRSGGAHACIRSCSHAGRYAEIDAAGEYVVKDASVRAFDMIGQRLYTGRVAVAQAALA